MLPRFLGGVGLAALVSACGTTNASAPPANILPLRTLRLYETGVGYFERSGTLRSQDGGLPVPAGHLDDALETLVVLSPRGQSTVHGVAFGSSISRGMARVLAGLPAEGGDAPIGMRDLLSGLKGASLEVRTRHGTVRGRLIEIAEAPAEPAAEGDAKSAAKTTAPKTPGFTLLLLTDGAALARVASEDVEEVRPLDGSYATRLGSALDALSTRGAQSRRMLDVLADGGGPVTLGYVAETPVWRTTYRLVLDATGKEGVLQAWALVHNDTDEDWPGVKVELVNGQPDSFLFPLAAPRYARRGLVTPENELATVPQLMDTTVDAIWGDRIGDSFAAGGLGLSGTGEGGGGRGEGIGLGSIGTLGHGGGTGTAESSELLEVGNLAGVAQAKGVEAGALFVYAMPEPVRLRAHASALLPFLQQRIDALPIAWFADAASTARSGVRFVNSTAQTLPAGTIAFFGDGGFAGESGLDRLKPGERRFITYGQDLDVELRVNASRAVEAPKRLVWNAASDQLDEHYLRTSDVIYGLENRSGRPRVVMLALDLDRNAKLTGTDEVEFDAHADKPVAVFRLEAKKRVDRATHSVEGLVRRISLAALTSATLTEAAASPTLEAQAKAPALEAAARLREAEADGKAALDAKAKLAEADKDIQRLREDMKALAGEHTAGAGPANPFAARVLAAEDRLTQQRKRIEALEADATGKRNAAKAALAKLAL